MSSSSLEFVDVAGWLSPKGYRNGALARGPVVFVAGQVGWNPKTGLFETDSLGEQFAIALDNVLAVVRAAGGGPERVAKMTVYVTDLGAYRAEVRSIGQAWRARFGRHFPAMALIGVKELVEPLAKVEMEAIAVLEET